MSKHNNYDDDMAYFEKTTVQLLQNLQFCTKEMKFVLGCIPIFDVKTAGMKINVDESTSITRWYFSTCVPCKTLITQQQDILTLIQMAKILYGIQLRRKKFINFMLPIWHIQFRRNIGSTETNLSKKLIWNSNQSQ